MRAMLQQPLRYRASVDRPRIIAARIKTIDAAINRLVVPKKDIDTGEAKARLVTKRAQLTTNFIRIRGKELYS